MKKILPLVLVLLSLVGLTGAQAQVRLGILGGLHTANILETNNIPGWDSAVHKYQTSHSGFQLGVILEMPLGHKGFFFQPAMLYTTRGRNYLKNNDSATVALTDSVYTQQNLSLNYIDIPLNLVYKLRLSTLHRNSFFISAGPYISFFYGGSQTDNYLNTVRPKYTTVSDPLNAGKGSDTYKLINLGINERVGFEFGNVMLSAYFSQGLTNFYTADYPGTFHHTLAGASLGIWLTSTTPPPPPPPKDTDMDGIPDNQDLCPLQPGTAKWHGCPVPDTDHDGIDDEHDSCRTVPGVARYNGCPIPDSDHDGINDEEDKCPNQPGLARYQGCPIPDRDGDGVNDEEDKCPDEPGTVENHGCPVIKKEVVEQINYTAKNILFHLGSNQLVPGARSALDDLSVLLLAHPEWQLTIEGYTDNAGKPERNLLLSQQRADAVKAWLVKKGVPADRLTATGYGMDHPIADNATEAGKTANRRVELKVNLKK